MLKKKNEPSMPKTLEKTLDVPTAGRRYFGLSRASSYAAAARGQLPTIRIGRKLFVSVVALDRMLADAKPLTDDA
jgi:hypothetical protein